MAKIKIAKGNAFVYSLPLVELNADGTKENVQATDVQDLQVVCARACGTSFEPEFTSDGNRLYISFGADLQVAEYNLTVTGSLHAVQDFALQMQAAFEIVQWDSQSNWRDYIIGDAIVPEDTPLIAGVFNSDAEWERLKEELRLQIAAAHAAEAAAQAAKREWEQKAAELDGVAKEATLTQGVQDIRADIANIDVDTSDLAKQGTNPNANITDIQALLEAKNIWNGRVVFDSAINLQSYIDLLTVPNYITEIYDDEYEGYLPSNSELFFQSGGLTSLKRLRKITMTKLLGTHASRYSLESTALIYVDFPSLTSWSTGNYSNGIPNIQCAFIPKLPIYYYRYFFIASGTTNMHAVVLLNGLRNVAASTNLSIWEPTYDMMANNINPLNDEFTTNGERLNYNLRTYLAAELSTVGQGQTITFSQVLRDAMREETEQAFASKGWNIAPAKSV